MQAPVAVRCFTNCYTLPLPLPLPLLWFCSAVTKIGHFTNCLNLKTKQQNKAPFWRIWRVRTLSLFCAGVCEFSSRAKCCALCRVTTEKERRRVLKGWRPIQLRTKISRKKCVNRHLSCHTAAVSGLSYLNFDVVWNYVLFNTRHLYHHHHHHHNHQWLIKTVLVKIRIIDTA